MDKMIFKLAIKYNLSLIDSDKYKYRISKELDAVQPYYNAAFQRQLFYLRIGYVRYFEWKVAHSAQLVINEELYNTHSVFSHL